MASDAEREDRAALDVKYDTQIALDHHGMHKVHASKLEVILNRASAWTLVVGRRAVKNPVGCLSGAKSCLMIFLELTGSFGSVPPRLRPRGTPLRMTPKF